jgi:FkbM family methyltransferase
VARLVDQPYRFALREFAPARKVASTYKLQGRDQTIVLRHRTLDLETFFEIYVRGHYDPPEDPELRSTLDSIETLADLGANVGLFGAWSLHWLPLRHIIAIEPDPSNLPLLRRCVELNSGHVRWEVIEALAGSAVGEVPFLAGQGPASRIAGPRDHGQRVRARRVDAFASIQEARLVKIDIEGGEWELLRDPRFAELPARVVVVEHHPHPSIQNSSPREYCARLLDSAGYRVLPGIHWSDKYGVLWGLRPE